MDTYDETNRGREFLLMATPFPEPPLRVKLAYRDIAKALNGTPEEKEAVGPFRDLPKPWIPATVQDPDLRYDIWAWLGEVVAWLNHDYTWSPEPLIPACWPQHPHIVNELAAVADQRRLAEASQSSSPLEEWHRYCLPSFIARMRERTRAACKERHEAWPGKSHDTRYRNEDARRYRQDRFASDLDALVETGRRSHGRRGPLRLIDDDGLEVTIDDY